MNSSSARSLRIGFAGAVVATLMGAIATPASAESTPADDAAQALGRGDGATAAQIIAHTGYATQPAVLAEIIYEGGVVAVGAGKGNSFAQAVPVAFVRGAVSLVTANTAFEQAAGIVAREGSKDVAALVPQLMPGGLAIVRTELAYAGIWLPALPN